MIVFEWDAGKCWVFFLELLVSASSRSVQMMLGGDLLTGGGFRLANWIQLRIKHSFFLFNILYHQIRELSPGAARSVSYWCRKRTCW